MSKTTLPPHGLTKYPWARWTDGKTRTLRQGRDFAISSDSFRRSVHKHASDNGLKAKTRVNGEFVTIVFSPLEDGQSDA